MDILKIQPGEIYKQVRGEIFYILPEPTIEAMSEYERNKHGKPVIHTLDEFMILETILEENVAFWIHILGVDREIMGWTYVWYTNKCDRENVEIGWERMA